MSGFWKGYANVTDDVRHTYEQVFFGQQTTGNLTANDVPGIKPDTPAAPATPDAEKSAAAALYGTQAEPTHAEREATAFAYEHAANAPGIRAEIEAASGQPYRYGDAPGIPNNSETNAHAHVDFYNSIWGKGQADPAQSADLYGPSPTQTEGGGLYGNAATEAPSIEAPKIEAPAIEPPNQGNDLSPGY